MIKEALILCLSMLLPIALAINNSTATTAPNNGFANDTGLFWAVLLTVAILILRPLQ